MVDIIGVGGLIYDFLCQVNSMPSLGETTVVQELKFNVGGKSGNAVVQASLLGDVSTAVIGKVGSDQYGKEQLENLKFYGVNTDFVKVTNEAPTSLAIVTIDRCGQNQILLASGADKLFCTSDISECHDVISRCKVLISNFEVPMDTCLKALSLAHQCGVTSILVPAPVPAGFTADMLPTIDVICPNEIEAGQLLGMTVDSLEAGKIAIDKFFELGKIRWPIITMGDKGAVVGVKPGLTVEIPAPKVNCIDSTGAGDSFAGAVAFHLAKNPSLGIDDIVSKAVFIASMSTTKQGTRPSYISSKDLETINMCQ